MFFYTFLPKLFNMSLTAGIVIIFVLLLRLMLKKSPKILSYTLWSIVLFRLLCPVSIESHLSLFGLLDAPVTQRGTMTSSMVYIPDDIVHEGQPSATLPIPGLGEFVQEALPNGEEQLVADPLEAPLAIATYVWMAGVAAMAIYAAASFLNLRRKLVAASLLRDNIYLADEVTSPFVMGLFHPKIYLPSALGEQEQSYIILHEQHHIRRWDHVWKVLGFAALCIHWFNPLVWLAFITAAKDMEMSCDEAVIKKRGDGILADYTSSLLSLATGRHTVAGMPLAFGEGDTKGRIRNLANWKRHGVWAVVLATLICVIVGIGSLTNPILSEDYFILTDSNSLNDTNKLSYDLQLGNQAMSGEVYVEQWSNGTCVKSAPVTLTQYADAIDITMCERRENEVTVGTEIAIETYQHGGSLLTYFAHPENLNATGWLFQGYRLHDKIKLSPNKEVILAAKVFDAGNGVRDLDCDTLVAKPEILQSTTYAIVIRAIFSTDPLSTINQEETSQPTQVLTLDDVIRLSHKGSDLKWSDFDDYSYYETGSGVYIRVYDIDDVFSLWIGGPWIGPAPDADEAYYFKLKVKNTDTIQTDIREGDIESFIRKHENP